MLLQVGQKCRVGRAEPVDLLVCDVSFVSVTKIYSPHKELHTVVAELMTTEHVPFLSALRYKPSGLKKRAEEAAARLRDAGATVELLRNDG